MRALIIDLFLIAFIITLFLITPPRKLTTPGTLDPILEPTQWTKTEQKRGDASVLAN